jgi:hypothetical protein
MKLIKLPVLIVLTFIWIVSRAAAQGVEDASAFGHRFWNATAGANFGEMAACFSTQVTVSARSSLLNPEWGLVVGPPAANGVVLDREKLVAGYRAMVTSAGVEKWKRYLDPRVTGATLVFSTVDHDGAVAPATRVGDVVMKVGTHKSPPFYVLRRDAPSVWTVINDSFDMANLTVEVEFPVSRETGARAEAAGVLSGTGQLDLRGLLRKAVAEKDPESCYILAGLYEKMSDELVNRAASEKARNSAMEWYRKAAGYGHEAAKAKVRAIDSRD